MKVFDPLALAVQCIVVLSNNFDGWLPSEGFWVLIDFEDKTVDIESLGTWEEVSV